MADGKKDYILNFRVSRDVYEKIKERASENRETISNLVRKVVEDSSEIIGDLSNELFGTRKDKTSEIIHYYEGKLAKESKCSKCGKLIKKGQKIQIGESKNGRKFHFCSICK